MDQKHLLNNMNANAHYELKKVLQLRLAEIQTKNSLYSLRAFAKHLGIHAASLSEFFNDKRQFSNKMSEKIIRNMGISPDQEVYLLNLINKSEETLKDVKRVQLDTDSYFLVSDPIYYSILCLIETHDFRQNYSWIAGRLRSTEDKVANAIERLLRVGMLKRNEENKLYYYSEHQLMTSDDVANASLRLRHAENLEAAKDALINLPVSERYFNFETLAVDKSKLPEIKKIINECRSKLVALNSHNEKNEVYEFCFNYFPRTYKETENNSSVHIPTRKIS